MSQLRISASLVPKKAARELDVKGLRTRVRTSTVDLQVFDFDGLKGRVRSSSYTPEPGHAKFEPMMRELQDVFKRHQQNGSVIFEYDTKVFYGRI